MKVWIGVAVLVGTLASSSAMALDGNDLLRACQATIKFSEGDTKVSAADVGQCVGIAEG